MATMTRDQVLAELERLGTEQNRTIYRRHGVRGAQFGVSHAQLGALTKQAGKVDHALARELWASGNYDARLLATKLADPREADAALLDAWAADLDCYPLSDALAQVAAASPAALERARAWIAADDEWIARTGWLVLANLALRDASQPDALFEEHLEIIEGDISSARNYVKDAMNSALIAIGSRTPTLRARAVEAARRIGTVVVDHGPTGCKTPAAEPYLEKVWARKRHPASP